MPSNRRTFTRRAERAGRADRKILVVDHDVDLRSTLVDHLEGQGYTVTAAADADQALQSMRSEYPDVILLDLLFPGLNGLQMLRSVRQDDPTIGVIVMTSLDDDGLAASTIQLGAHHCLRKPFGLDRLDRVVRSAAGLRRKSGPSTRSRSW